MKLWYELEIKQMIPVKDSKNHESEFKDGLYVDITNHFSFLRFSANAKAWVLNWNFVKENWQDVFVALNIH